MLVVQVLQTNKPVQLELARAPARAATVWGGIRIVCHDSNSVKARVYAAIEQGQIRPAGH